MLDLLPHFSKNIYCNKTTTLHTTKTLHNTLHLQRCSRRCTHVNLSKKVHLFGHTIHRIKTPSISLTKGVFRCFSLIHLYKTIFYLQNGINNTLSTDSTCIKRQNIIKILILVFRFNYNVLFNFYSIEHCQIMNSFFYRILKRLSIRTL